MEEILSIKKKRKVRFSLLLQLSSAEPLSQYPSPNFPKKKKSGILVEERKEANIK